MQKVVLLLSLIFALGLFSNKINLSVHPNKIISQKKSFTLDSIIGNCDYGCAHFQIKAEKLNTKEFQQILADIFQKEGTTSKNMDNFFSSYQAVIDRFPEYGTKWQNKTSFKLKSESDFFYTLKKEEKHYTGGAHGHHVTAFYHYLKNEHSRLQKKDFFKNQDLLQVSLLNNLKVIERIPLQENINQHGYLVEDKNFPVSDNFYFCENGITFVYQHYEIAPYASGSKTIFISYHDLKEILKIEEHLLIP